MPVRANPFVTVNLLPCPPTPAELEQRRLDRLRELRAVIDSLRGEQASQDPLLAWAIAQERIQDNPRA
jgi:hypothetical protein